VVAGAAINEIALINATKKIKLHRETSGLMRSPRFSYLLINIKYKSFNHVGLADGTVKSVVK
jgi:hypothetical protein